MAKPKRTAAQGKPVTQHQLFPAVVALWFGALFGLGSLAVRPSLLEELVIKSRIDLLVPVAAPPLGMTARMLVALVLATLGAMLGIKIARRIARPKQEPRERKRTTLSTRDEGRANVFHGNADASTHTPPAADGGDAAAAPGMLAGRRRALAIEEVAGEFVLHELAPLPGGAPQIFDIAMAGLNDTPAAEPAPAAMADRSEPTPAPTQPPVALDWANAAPVLPPTAIPQAIETSRQMFQPAEQVHQIAPVATPEPEFPVDLPEPGDGRQVFGMAPPATPPVEQPRQIFGMPVVADHVPKEFVEAQGFRTSVFETPEPSPLFAPRAEPAHTPEPAAIPEAYAPPVEAVTPAESEPPAAPAAAIEPEPALPSPGTLGMQDLSARLAESMRRRRAGRAGPSTDAVSETVAEPVPQSEPLAAAEAVPAFVVPPYAVPPFVVPAPTEPSEPLAAIPAAVAADELPVGLRPLDLTGFEEEDRAVQASDLPPRWITTTTDIEPVGNEPEAAEEAEVAEGDYGSLLGVTPSPVSLINPYVRVEESEAEAETVEPVVIFPGQAVPAPQPFAPAASEEALPFRRFDAPANAEQGQQSAANEAVSIVPPEEAERALRSALANLQRMSGAA